MANRVRIWLRAAAPLPFGITLYADHAVADLVADALAPYFMCDNPDATPPALSLEHRIGPVSVDDTMLSMAANHRGDRIWRAGPDSVIYAIGDEPVRYTFSPRTVTITTERADRTAVQALKRAVYIGFIRQCRKAGFLHLHAGAVRCGAGAFVFIGEKGAGKTTTVLSALDMGWDFVSNDQVLVGPVAGCWRVLGLPVSIRIGAETAALFPHRNLPHGESILGVTEVAEKFASYVEPHAPLLGCVLLCRDAWTRPTLISIDDHISRNCLAQIHSFSLPSMHQPFWPKEAAADGALAANVPVFAARFCNKDVPRILEMLRKRCGDPTLIS